MIAAAALALLSAMNFVYQILHKPTELLSSARGAFDKTPAETWREYGPLFREYSTALVPPALLAALAQVEGAGNPIASTYWRWRLTWNPFAVYAPASSSVGMYQMTDAAFAEARRYCIRHHVVTEEGCRSNRLDLRVLPHRAIELTAVFLHRNLKVILARLAHTPVTQQLKQELAAIIHLCGAGPAEAFARRGFYLSLREHCGDHAVAKYLSRVEAMKQRFLRLAADG